MGKRLSPAEWAEIVTLYERGEASQAELAERFGVTRQAIQSGLRDRGVVMGARLPQVQSEIEDAAAEARGKRIRDAAAFKERHVKFNDIISGIVMKKVVEANQSNNLIGINAELVTLRTAGQIIKRAREENWKLLGLENIDDEDDQLPELGVSIYTPEELDQIQRANEEAYNEHIAEAEENSSGKLIGDDELPEEA